MRAAMSAPLDWTEARPRRRGRRGPLAWLFRALQAGVLAVVLTAGSYAAYCGIIIYEGNFNTVRQGVLYRSAQPDKSELRFYARKYGIKSVLNLRGAHPGDAWYDGEMAAAHALRLVHYDYPISAKRFVTSRQIAEILKIVRAAPKPLLIHCQSGADRSGLVAALYDYAVAGDSAQQADRQLSLLYGHFPYLTSRSGAMDASFWAYVHLTAHRAAQ
jgi:protein tyrosine/serine phosphatase